MRSYDVETLKKGASRYPEGFLPGFDYQAWLDNENNIMYIVGDDVGLLTYEYPGLYNGHWFFSSRGREAKRTATKMLDELFTTTEAKAVRGITDTALRGAIWLARQVGFVSTGVVEYRDGPCELLCLTKQAFYDRINNG